MSIDKNTMDIEINTSKVPDIIKNNEPNNLYELIEQTYKEYNENIEKYEDNNYANALLNILKKYHYWPLMQIKKFKNNNFIVLLHNTYTRNGTETYKNLYDQCRSIVLDFSLSINNNVVVSYANSIPNKISLDVFEEINDSDNYSYYEAYDGTMINIYNYNDEWFFGTISCTDINYSKFTHPTKSHGDMLDEILLTFYKSSFTEEEFNNNDKKYISDKLRKLFTSNLDKNIAYEFVIIHNDNKRIMDYSSLLGDEYKFLFHISSKNRVSLIENDIIDQPLASIGIKYPKKFNNFQEAKEFITNNLSYGCISKKVENNIIKMYKISTQDIVFKEDTNPCNPNNWINILIIYMKNNPNYKICDYIKNYCSDITLPIDNNNKEIDPTYLIHTTICTIKDILYNLYISTTNYYSKYNRFKMKKELDKQFAPIIQYHLAQLRYLQTTTYKGKIITSNNVYHYLCQCNNVKNIKTLIGFLSINNGYNIPPRSAVCISILNNLLN